VRGWSPILEGSTRQTAYDVVESIVSDLLRDPRPNVPGMSDPFITILLAEASRALGRPSLLAHAVDRLNTSIRIAATQPIRIGLYNGWCGIAWVATWLEHSLPSRGRAEDPCADVDVALEEILLSWDVTKQEYDLISGLVGIGVYALQRKGRGSADRILSLVIAKLSDGATRTTAGTTWQTASVVLPPALRESSATSHFNLGVAHGVPGVVALLGHMYRQGIDSARTSRLASSASAWILGQQLPDGDGARFPHWVSDADQPSAGRMAWCYGGLGISAAMMIAGCSLRRAAWRRAAVQMALMESERPWERTGVTDACLCHGASGIALIFQRFHAATEDKRFQRAARAWFDRILAMNVPGQGIGGYQFVDNTGQISPDAAVLSGSAGVALALLAGASAVAPSWDSLLLTDIPS
jgi:hypothetical protein